MVKKSKKKKPRKRIIDTGGYVQVYSPNHPFKKTTNYVCEHRLVVENWLRTNKPDHLALVEVDGMLYLHREWQVHHWNEVRDDNTIDNLHPATSIEHKQLHKGGPLVEYLETLDEEAKARWKGAMVRGMAIKRKRRAEKRKSAVDIDMYISAKEAFSEI